MHSKRGLLHQINVTRTLKLSWQQYEQENQVAAIQKEIIRHPQKVQPQVHLAHTNISMKRGNLLLKNMELAPNLNKLIRRLQKFKMKWLDVM